MVRDDVGDKVFIDSDAFIALNDASDNLHEKAEELSVFLVQKQTALYTSTNVVLEVATMLSQRFGHAKGVNFLKMIRGGELTVVHPTEEIILTAEEIFKKQTSKNVSYSDCVSIAVMSDLEIETVFSFDRDFKKNNLNLLIELSS